MLLELVPPYFCTVFFSFFPLLFFLLLPSSLHSIAVYPLPLHSLPAQVTAVKSKETVFAKANSVVKPIIKLLFHLTKHIENAAHWQTILAVTSASVCLHFMFIFFAWDCSCKFPCLGAMNAENIAGRPRSLILMSVPPPLTSPTSPGWSDLSVTLQTSQLSCFFIVKVLTNHERCQYRGPLIRFWLAHESCHTYVCSELVWPRSTVRDGRPTTVWGETDGGPNGLTHTGFSATRSLCRCEQHFGFSQHDADPNLWIW